MPAAGDSTCTFTHYKIGQIHKLIFDCVMDSGDGSFTSFAVPDKIEGRLLALETNPGSTAPTANYDIWLGEANEATDMMQGVGNNRHTSNTEKVPIVYSGTETHPTIDAGNSALLVIFNNIVVSATVSITIYYAMGG